MNLSCVQSSGQNAKRQEGSRKLSQPWSEFICRQTNSEFLVKVAWCPLIHSLEHNNFYYL